MNTPFELLLFAPDGETAAAAESAGIDGIVVDWENRGKDHRQTGWDTQINYQTIEDLRAIRRATLLPVICRINGFGSWTAEEVSRAIAEGADEILLPMVREPQEVERTLELAAGRVTLGMLIETVEAVARVDAFNRLPLARVYVGLNDLAIERGTSNLFAAVADGTVEEVRRATATRFGFGGLTLPDRGAPVPCALLLAEMVRLNCHFSFLRRSFLRDVPVEHFPSGVARLRAGLAAASMRNEAEASIARHALCDAVMAWT
jgi:2-keto-3-deoxy-L-rhamnonate aldolase RhmA